MADNDEPPLFSSDLIMKILAGVAVVGAVYFIYRMHPRTTFAADGLSQRWDATVEQSKAAHMPSLVLFTADWCPACSALHSGVLSQPMIQQEISGHYLMITVDMTSPSASASARSSRYGVGGIPTLIRFDADGHETERTHYLPPEKMLTFLKDGE